MTSRLDPTRAAILAVAFAGNLLLIVLAVRSPAAAIGVALAPVAAAAFVALAASDRSILLFAAFALPVSLPVFDRPIPLGGVQIFSADLIVLLAVGAWLAGRLTGAAAARHPAPPVLELAFPVFAILALVDAERGHAANGASLAGEPLRLVVYAAIALAVLDLSPAKAFRGLGVVLYAGAFWSLLSAVYYLGTGGSQTQAASLSTGGTRVLSLSVSLHLAAALFFALLCFDLPRTGRQRALDSAAGVAALVGIVLSFGRGTFLAVALAVPVLVIAGRRLRGRFVASLPLLVPLAVVATLLVVSFAPGTAQTLTRRVQIGFVSQGSDASVEWRARAVHTIWQQVREAPLVGVGFGRGGTFELNGVSFDITQDPHNGFVWLAAAGGFLLLGSFVGVLVVYVLDVLRRLRRAGPTERALLIWGATTLAAILLNTAVGPLLSTPDELLVIWALLVLPAIVEPTPLPALRPHPVGAATAFRSPARPVPHPR